MSKIGSSVLKTKIGSSVLKTEQDRTLNLDKSIIIEIGGHMEDFVRLIRKLGHTVRSPTFSEYKKWAVKNLGEAPSIQEWKNSEVYEGIRYCGGTVHLIVDNAVVVECHT